jgi:RNA methyltransferase, TrmH family
LISKNHIKDLKALQLKKFRQLNGLYIAEGTKITEEIISTNPEIIVEGFALSSWDGWQRLEFDKSLINLRSRFSEINEKELDQISSLENPNQVLLVLSISENEVDPQELHKGVSLYLDDIRDPGNMGTIIRLADWFGVSQVICSADCVDRQNSKVVQSTMGSFLRVKTPVMSLGELKNTFPDIVILGAVLDGENLYSKDNYPNGLLIVIGNESNGISPDNLKLLDGGITIPKHGSSGAESLNAAISTGIILGRIVGEKL